MHKIGAQNISNAVARRCAVTAVLRSTVSQSHNGPGKYAYGSQHNFNNIVVSVAFVG